MRSIAVLRGFKAVGAVSGRARAMHVDVACYEEYARIVGNLK